MLGRAWHGWTTPATADAYEALLKRKIVHGIQDRGIAGFRGMQVCRREQGDVVEFTAKPTGMPPATSRC